jgi:hypothetical protein
MDFSPAIVAALMDRATSTAELVAEPQLVVEPQVTQGRLLNITARLRCRWMLVGRFVLSMLRARKAWSALGQRLNLYAGMFQHLERKKGVLLHKNRER